jgi:heterodisulfide reductase subunit C
VSLEKQKPITETKIVQATTEPEQKRRFLKEVMKLPGGDRILECIQCGTCAGGCPTRFAMDYSPMQIIKMINLNMEKAVLSSSTIWVCSTCYTCTARCPRKVDFTTLMMSLRNKAIQKSYVRKQSNLKFHKSFFEVIDKYGRLYEPEMILKVMSKTDFGELRRNVGLGLRLMKKGKIRIKAPKTSQSQWLGGLAEKTKEES